MTSAILLTACGSDPDLLALGARELPGTAGADYLAAKPFSIAPGGKQLLFAVASTPGTADEPDSAFHLRLLTSFRLYDLATEQAQVLPSVPAELQETISRYGVLHEAPCWTGDSRMLLLRTPFRSYLQLGPLDREATWSLVEKAPPDLDPGCGERPGPFIGSRRIGPFLIDRPGGTGLVVSASSRSKPLFETEASGPGGQINVREARLAPSGDRLAMVYSSGTGSFTGRPHGLLLSVRDGEQPVRKLGAGPLILGWLDNQRLVGYARADGRRDHALFTWDLAN